MVESVCGEVKGVVEKCVSGVCVRRLAEVEVRKSCRQRCGKGEARVY